MEHDEAIKKVAELMKDVRTGMLTTVEAGSGGLGGGPRLVSRPMALQTVEFDGDLWFFTYDNSDKIQDIQGEPSVNVAFEGKNSWVSLSGSAQLVEDRAKAEELWNPVLKAWFPGGVDEPGLALIKVHAESAEYWDTTSNKLVNLFGMAKAAVTGQRAQGGENETVEL